MDFDVALIVTQDMMPQGRLVSGRCSARAPA